MDFLITVSPGEPWASTTLITGAPSGQAAKQMYWAHRGYNSGEPLRVSMLINLKNTLVYDQKLVDNSLEAIRYND